jgi:hypothetical protein
MGDRRLVTIDCETDPFKHGRIPKPFVWGSYDGNEFIRFNNSTELLDYWSTKNVWLVAHNGGKFDFLFMLHYVTKSRVLEIGGRVVQMKIGNALLRDSFSILPMALAAYSKTPFEYWKMEVEFRDQFKDEITSYLADDCRDLYELVDVFMETAGKKSTIAANAMAHARKLGIDVGKTHAHFDDKFRMYYYGGRVEVFKGGEFANVDVFDIKSSYPNAMKQNHPTGDEGIVIDSLDGLNDDAIGQSFVHITCHSTGAFPRKDDNGALCFPVGEYEFKVTGWEYLIAKKHGLISNEEIHSIFIFNESITFGDYVDHWFEHKDRADKDGDAAQRIVGKIMLNSLYGKTAQNPRNYSDCKIVPNGTKVDYDEGWALAYEYENIEVHKRPTLWKYQQKYGDDWQSMPLFYNVATGASITGFARAHLLDAICTVGIENVIYCDTDSMILEPGTDVSGLRRDGKLGAWEWEGTGNPCYVAGKKMYGLKWIAGPNEGKEKLAHKGAKLTFDEIRRVSEGETVEWKNDAPSLSLVRSPKFVVRSIRATALNTN